MSPRMMRAMAIGAAAVVIVALLPYPASAAPSSRSTVIERAPDPKDVAWTTSGDATGLHVLAATALSGYQWRTVATLAEPGFDTDRWIGNACLTGSARRLVVVYAPRTFTNRADLFDRGGFTAVVDLVSGATRKLPVMGSLAYFNPGCGVGETAIVTQLGGQAENTLDSASATYLGTRLFEVDAAAGRVSEPIVVESQLTSAIPTGDGIVAAGGSRLLKVERDGRVKGLTPTSGTPFHLTAAADGGIVFMDTDGQSGSVRHARPNTGESARLLAQGPLMNLSVTAGAAGRILITGRPDRVNALPSGVSQVDIEPDALLSSHGDVALTEVGWIGSPDSRVRVADPSAARPVRIHARFLNSGRQQEFQVKPGDGPGTEQGLETHPKLRSGADSGLKAAAASPTDPVEAEAWCSVPRNDPANQAMQPKPRQVEWAIDQAVMNSLNVQRPANWKNLGMPAYQPQQLFPPLPLTGGGRVPAQIMLGIAAQESNMWEATFHALPGVTANPLIGNFYGRPIYDDVTGNDWDIVWSKADCGYGVMQITDGMRKAGFAKPGEVPWPYQTQRAVALDFAANVAAGLRILQDKWNQTRMYGMTVNSGDPGGLESWFFAIWAYNSGFHFPGATGQPWGVGWSNNPVNPNYPANRPPFMEYCACDAAQPQQWPYPEKVIGFAGHPPELPEGPDVSVAGFRAAWWTSAENRIEAKPPFKLFCNATNDCYPGQSNLPTDPEVIGDPAGPCAHRNASGQFDLKCWFHTPASWKEGEAAGNEVLRFDPGYAYQDDATSYAPKCDLGGLPSGALIIDDVVDAVKSVRPNCTRNFTNAGKLDFQFYPDPAGLYPSKVDFHQIGGGFNGHFYFAHTRKPGAEGGKLKVDGTWRFSAARNGWGRLFVHLPDHGAHTQQAKYDIDLGTGSFTQSRYINQHAQEHRWVSLGVFKFVGVPRVRLSTETKDGYGEEDVAWDAIAMQPLSAKPKNVVVALGDSYSSGEGAGSYYRESDTDYGNESWNACRRSREGYIRKTVLPGLSSSIGSLADSRATNLDLTFLACGGARTHNMINWQPNSWTDPSQFWRSDGQFREMPQLEAGYLNADTTLVTVSAGGNDADFINALMECGGLTNCANGDLEARYRAKIDSFQASVATLIDGIRAKASAALIVYMGYPKIFSDTVKCSGTWYFDLTEAAALNRLAVYMSDKISQTVAAKAAAGARVVYANPIAEFEDHGACDGTEYVHKFVDGPTGPGDPPTFDDDNPFCFGKPGTVVVCISRSSFHPNTAGTSAYARVLQTTLNGRYSGA